MSYLEEFKEKNIDMGFNAAMGIEVLELEDDYSKVRIPIKDWEQNPINAVHGGIIFALGDVVGALATWKMGKMVTTQSCHISECRHQCHRSHRGGTAAAPGKTHLRGGCGDPGHEGNADQQNDQ